MKKIKKIAITAMFCATAFASYIAYDHATMTDQEKLFQANLEALTQSGESGTWYAGYTEGEATFNNVTIPCCVSSSPNNACNYGSVSCITTM